jgi:hypothetical protein
MYATPTQADEKQGRSGELLLLCATTDKVLLWLPRCPATLLLTCPIRASNRQINNNQLAASCEAADDSNSTLLSQSYITGKAAAGPEPRGAAGPFTRSERGFDSCGQGSSDRRLLARFEKAFQRPRTIAVTHRLLSNQIPPDSNSRTVSLPIKPRALSAERARACSVGRLQLCRMQAAGLAVKLAQHDDSLLR